VLEEFAVTAGYASELEQREGLGPVIVVGVGYPYDANTPGKGRLRDLTIPLHHPDAIGGATGGALEFYAFLRTELLPWVERNYRVAGPQGRALFGHSLGGLFTTWAFLQHDAAAPVFTGFVAASPSLHFDQAGIYAHLDEAVARNPPMPVALSVTVGDLEGPEMVVYFDDFTERLHARNFKGLTLDTHKYPTDHLGTVAPSFRDGLRFVFANGLSEAP
jgi:predicted alpha/beta superfamily hydrolase